MDNMALNEFISKTTHKTPSYHKKLHFIYAQIKQYSEKNNKDIADLKILEAGCGDGGITLPLISLGCKIRSFDIDEKSVKNIQNIIRHNNIKNIEVSTGNAYTFNDNQSYDIIILSEVIEHVLDPKKVLNNLTNMMDRSSYLILTCPNGHGPWELRNRMLIYPVIRSNKIRNFMGKPQYIHGSGEDHCQFYKKNDIMDFLRNKFSLISFSSSDSILATLDLIYSKNQTLNNLFGKLDTKIADHVPHWLGSGWYFCFEKS